MRLTKKVPYKLKTLIPALGLAGASILSGCKDKNEPELNPQHDAVFVFGYGNFSSFEPAHRYVLAFDSAEVKNVILQSDGETWKHLGIKEIYKQINLFIKMAPENKKYKLKGRGILLDVYINSVTDSTTLANFGFEFKNAVNKPDYSLWESNQKQR